MMRAIRDWLRLAWHFIKGISRRVWDMIRGRHNY